MKISLCCLKAGYVWTELCILVQGSLLKNDVFRKTIEMLFFKMIKARIF